MTDHERALLLFIAERLRDELLEASNDWPDEGWLGLDLELRDLNALIGAVRSDSTAPRADEREDGNTDG
jgi:hypothetical protein